MGNASAGKGRNRTGAIRNGVPAAGRGGARLRQKDRKDAAPRNRVGTATREGNPVKKSKTIPAERLFRKWRRDPAFQREYEALEEEFALAAALIEARSRADLTQEQLAKRMKTTQAVIARLESGRTMPSTRTLARIAAATGTRLRIRFEPAP
jgi:ribosome-binding protein aMBF1 (putative translation factor)